MPSPTILVDSRERQPWQFSDYPVETMGVTLETGDYTLERFCDYDGDNDTYQPRYAVERKTGPDFLQSITQQRDRFEREIRRASDWDRPLLVLIEEPWNTFSMNRRFMAYRQVAPSQVEGTVNKWSDQYNVTWRFVGQRYSAERFAYEALLGD